MTELVLNYLGDYEVRRCGQLVSLPPSRKTRALLAYLSLNPRKFRREFLCELLWEVPDDPRGSLRWSLSKLRRSVDDDGQQRILADRTHVEFDRTGVNIDAVELQALAGSVLADIATDNIEQAVLRYRGNFLEGLDLPNFHDFHAWCIAERDQVARAQATLLRELVGRLENESLRALPYIRALVMLSPYDEVQRAQLIRVLVSLDRNDEAEQQYQLGLRMLKEVGVGPDGAMHAALQRLHVPPSSPDVGSPDNSADNAARANTVEASSGLVGRELEAKQLVKLFRNVCDQGTAQFALIRGEPGIGKTRLVDAVSALALGAGATVLTASAYESGSIRPFALWTDAMHRHDQEAFTEVFADQDAGNRDRLFDRLSEFVARRTDADTLVLVFDDIQWCDDSSAAAIHYVARMNRGRPLFGMLAVRDGELLDNVAAQQALAGLRRDGVLSEIALGPLSEQDVAELIARRAPGVRANDLSRRCGGNPLLAIELARAEQEGDRSTSVTELVRERLARSSVEGTEVLQWAAVLNPYINVETLASLVDLDPGRIGEVLESAERQGMLSTTSGGLTFSHDLLAKAVYTTLSPLRRQVMHRRIADLLEKSAALDLGRAAERAHHASQSGDPGLAARAMVSAGRLCLRYYANEEALTLFKRGMQLVDQLPDADRVCVTIDLHDVRMSAGPLDNWESAACEYARLAEQALDHGKLAHARLGYHMSAYLRWTHGQWTYAREESLQSERVVRSGSEEDHIVGMAETAKCLVMIERDLSKADAMLMEAEALSSRKGFSHFAIPAGLGMLRFHEGKIDEAIELLKESCALCKSAGARIDEFLVNEQLMMIAFECGQFEQARSYCETLKLIGEKIRAGSEAPFAHALSALCEYALHDRSECLDTALAALRDADAKHRLAYVLTRVAQLDFKRGRLETAGRRATEALSHATLLGRATEMLLARSVLAVICRTEGDAAALVEHEAAITQLREIGVAHWATAHIDKANCGQHGAST